MMKDITAIARPDRKRREESDVRVSPTGVRHFIGATAIVEVVWNLVLNYGYNNAGAFIWCGAC